MCLCSCNKTVETSYSEWYSEKIRTDYFSLDNCPAPVNYSGSKEFAITETPEFIYGHLNDDAQIDAFINLPLQYCLGGNNFRFEKRYLVFISNLKKEYNIVQIKDSLNYIGLGEMTNIKGKGIIGYSLRYKDIDAECCPTDTGGFELKFYDNLNYHFKVPN